MSRLDKWLQVSRMFRARSKAAAACSAGRVTVNGQQAKAHRQLRVGDRIEFRVRDWKRILVVQELRDKPLPKAAAPRLYEDLSPPKPEPSPRDPFATLTPAQRRRGAGRPTKRDRRMIDRLR
jgi:ribosome-associated heat shock protein Hsp15